MHESPFGLIEFGSNSLKFYRVIRSPRSGYSVETRKIPWSVAHTFFSRGCLDDAAASEILEALRKVAALAPDLPLKGMLSVATGVFREVPGLEELAGRIRDELGLRLRVISGEDEAKLMARGFRTHRRGSILLADLGGGTTEWAWIDDGRPRSWGSLRLGCIRNHHAVGGALKDKAAYVRKSRELCAAELKALPMSTGAAVLATGGTARTLARCREGDTIGLEELRETILEVQENGPPESVEPERRKVFLAGLVILERIAERCGADALEYAKTSVREGMAMRLVELLGRREPRDLRATLLLRATDSGVLPLPPSPEDG